MGKLAVTLAACVAALFALNVVHLVTPARAGTSVPAGNGDVNGDAEIDISDAVYLLRFLFQEGTPPAACADSPSLVSRVAELEERLAAVENPCRSRLDRFQDNGDGTVTDTCTGLMWQKGSEDINSDGHRHDDTLSWDAAVAYCTNLSLGGHSGWRLPSLHEVEDLRAAGSESNPWAPPGEPFAVYPSEHWTSTRHPNSDYPDAVWVVEFQNNLHQLQTRFSAALVLAVRRP